MEVQVTTTRKIVLSLTEEETIWLLGMVQNPMVPAEPQAEQPENKTMRTSFFESISKAVAESGL